MKGFDVVAMDVETHVFDLSGLDHLGTGEGLGNLRILRILESCMRANKGSFYGVRFCLNFAYTLQAQGATRVLFAAKVI